MARHIIMRLEAPLMSFGGETIDNYGVIRPFPASSMLAGLFANALGWRRTDREQHQGLQDRLVFAARIDREPAGGVRMTDFQTAKLEHNDRGWTTRGRPDERDGGAKTYDSPHLRYRDYFADMQVTVALRLQPDADAPTLDQLAAALDEPARPLFLGRKPCLPSAPLLAGFGDGVTALDALRLWPLADDRPDAPGIRTLWPQHEGVDGIESARSYLLTDQRNWLSGLHGGGRLVHESSIPRRKFGPGHNHGAAMPEEGRP